MKNKTLLGAVLGVLGCVVLKESYNRGYNKGVEECKNRLKYAFDIADAVKKRENEEEES